MHVKRTDTQYAMLGFLVHEPMTGYDIKQMISRSTGYFMDPSYGTIYPTLKCLTKDGWIKATKIADDARGKIQYAITTKGRRQFDEWLNAPIPISAIGNEHLIRVFFYRHLPTARRLELLKDGLNRTVLMKHELLQLDEQVGCDMGQYERQTYLFGLSYYDAMASWFQTMIDESIE